MSRSGLRPEDLRALLDRLSSAREEAGSEYERLRNRLVRFFGWEHCSDPDALADACLDVVARKLAAGEEIRDVKAYTVAVAGMMAKEERTRRRREQAAREGPLRMAAFPEPADEELDRDLTDLDGCLERFTSEQRDLILRYYEGDHAHRIRNRKILAEELGMLPGALRTRALRLREALETCMAQRRERRNKSALNTTKSRGSAR